MSKRHLLVLALLAMAAALAVVLLVPRETGRESGPDNALLLPEVDERINETDQVTLQGFGQAGVRLERAGGKWLIADLHDYPADWNRVRSLLADLAQASIVEPKTDNPAYYDRLGVEDPAGEGAAGVLLTLRFDGEQRSLIVGKRAASRGGQYVRPADAARAVLVDREFDLPLKAVDWAEREIVDVAAGEVREVEIIHPDGNWVLVRKNAKEATDFALENLPEGREPVSSWSVNSLAGALAALSMEGVEPLGDAPPEMAVRLRLLTFSGEEYLLRTWEEEDAFWLTLGASRPLRESGEVVSDEKADGVVEDRGADMDATELNALDQRVSGWRYRIPEYKYTALTKRLEDLLQPLDDSDPAGD